MMKLVVFALFGAALAVPTIKLSTSSPGISSAFELWKKTYNRSYATQEEHDRRLEIFTANSILVEKHNAEGHSWTMGLNQFADMTPKEFAELQTLWPSTLGTENSSAPMRHEITGKDIPASVDWRTQGYVNPIKNQGQCGSCWAFSTIVSYEGQVARKSQLESFSEQDLVDCVKGQSVPGQSQTCCDGCNGGLMDYAFAYMIAKQNGEDDTEASYPYKAADGTCSFKAASAGSVPVKSYTDIAQGDEASLKDAVANVGPISVAVNANIFWQLYSGGVFKPLYCNGQLNHGVAVVGYGTDSGKNYWIVRNSWGSTWGEQGYMRIVSGSNECGIADSAVYPVV
jgi:C1A family cysteine protease